MIIRLLCIIVLAGVNLGCTEMREAAKQHQLKVQEEDRILVEKARLAIKPETIDHCKSELAKYPSIQPTSNFFFSTDAVRFINQKQFGPYDFLDKRNYNNPSWIAVIAQCTQSDIFGIKKRANCGCAYSLEGETAVFIRILDVRDFTERVTVY